MKPDLWSRFCATAQAYPDKTGIVQGEESWTFRRWYAEAERYAALFRMLGVRSHDRVLIWSPPSPVLAAAVGGIWANGAIVVLMDPEDCASHFEHALATVEPTLIVHGPANHLPATSGMARSWCLGDSTSGVSQSAAPPTPILSTDAASIVFTSGSTGKPKGVTQSHGNLVRGCRAVGHYLGYEPGERILCGIPWAFDYGFGHLLTSVILGCTLVLPTAPNPFAICEAIERHRPTVLPVIPSLLTYLFRGVSPLRQTDLSSIRIITNTGGTIPSPILNSALEAFKDVRFVLNYGLTETYRTSYLDPSMVRTHPNSIGRPIPGVDVVIVRDDGSLAEPNETGMIVHRGDYICLGYWNDPEATDRAIRRDPLAPDCLPGGGRALYTGDYGYLDPEGLLYFKGRRDHLMKSMGVRINPSEIEAILYRCGVIEEVAVFGVKHELIGDEVWAAISINGSQPIEETQKIVKEFCRSRLTQYMIPRRFLFKTILPKTRTGKIDYEALRREAEERRSAFGVGK